MLTLAIDSGDGSELRYDLTKEVVSIGASSNNDVVLRSPGVAPVHVVIRHTGQSVTFFGQPRQIVLFNGERRSRGVLNAGDRLRVGTATIVIVETKETAARDEDTESPETPSAAVDAESGGDTERETRIRPEVVLYTESKRLAEARRRLLDVFRTGVHSDLVEPLQSFLGSVFHGRGALLAWLDQQGMLQPIVSGWGGAVPQLPARTFAELEHGDRIAVLRGSGPEVLIYPVVVGGTDSRTYLLAESSSDSHDEDRTLLAELADMISLHWGLVAGSSTLLGEWEKDARNTLESRLPGSSQMVRELRERVVEAAKTADPLLLIGHVGSGRSYLASLIASLRPTGKPWLRVVQSRGADDSALRRELFGGETTIGARELATRAGGGVVVVRAIERMSIPLQGELAAVIAKDIGIGYGSRVRWILTGAENCEALVAQGAIDHELYALVANSVIRVPTLEERREDLPLLIVRMLETVGEEQGKDIRGITLETLDALLASSFEGQMTELLTELRRLVSATPEGELVQGSLRRTPARSSVAAEVDRDEIGAAAVLEGDDLKVVIPAIERLLIDRVLRRSLGNQSRAARELNLSRGALIAKIKEYGIPDYRSLRKNKR